MVVWFGVKFEKGGMMIILLSVALLVVGCGFSSDKQGGSGAVPPAFAAQPFSYITKDWATSLTLQHDGDCIAKMEHRDTAGAAMADALGKSESGNEIALGMAGYGYAQALFYDCNMRQQAREDGAEIVDETDVRVLHRSHRQSAELWDGTRFVEWEEQKDSDTGEVPMTDGEADTVTGKMVNLYLQENGFRTQTRIELDKQDGLRQIASVFFLQAGEGKNVVQRSYLVEHGSGTDKEHLLGLRLYHHDYSSKIYLALAHLKDSGSAVLFATCDIGAGEDFNKSCADASFGGVRYFDAERVHTAASSALEKQFKVNAAEFLENSSGKWAHGKYAKDELDPRTAFFSGEGDTDANREGYFKSGIPVQN